MKNFKILKLIAIILSCIFIFSTVSCSYALNYADEAVSLVLKSLNLEENNLISGSFEEEEIENKKDDILKDISPKADRDLFIQYFAELGLGKLLDGCVLPSGLIKKDNQFISFGKDRIILYGQLLKAAELEITIFDIENSKEVKNDLNLWSLNAGVFTLSEPAAFPAGNYEYIVRINDTIVGVFPFKLTP